MTLVGALGQPTRATVDASGTVTLDRAPWRLEWWIGADDRWRVPAEEVSRRQRLVDAMPVVRTAVRIPNGDAIQYVFGVADGSLIAEVENDSPGAFALALVIRGAHHVEVDDAAIVVDGRAQLRTPRPAQRWAVSLDGTVRDLVLGGEARAGECPPLRDRRGRIDAAFLYPVAHRTTWRATLFEGRLDDGDRHEMARVGAEDTARGWLAQLDRGMHVELPDPRLQTALARARAQTVLAAGLRSDADVLAALESWGLDDEAAAAWARASMLDRWRARRLARQPVADEWPDPVEAPQPGDDARLLRAARDLLAREVGTRRAGARGVEILRAIPERWRGADLDVRGVPLLDGVLSYAVRWHGDRPAVLWEAPAGVAVRAPGLDPHWSSREASGEALLAAR